MILAIGLSCTVKSRQANEMPSFISDFLSSHSWNLKKALSSFGKTTGKTTHFVSLMVNAVKI
jgi:hypothetical protein